MNDSFSVRLHLSRRDLKMNQKELAARAGVRAGYISELETGGADNPTLKVIESLAKALGVRPEYLAGWSDDALGEDRPANVAEGRLVYDAATAEERLLVQEVMDLLHEMTPEYRKLALQVLETFRKAQNVRIIGDE